MKALIPLALLVTGSTWGAEPQANLEAAVSAFRGSFSGYQAALKDAPEADEPVVENDESRVQLETFSVVGSIARHDLEKAIHDHAVEQARTEIERSFSWKRGGMIATKKIGAVTADLGLWPRIESIYSRGAFGTADFTRLRVDLLHLRW